MTAVPASAVDNHRADHSVGRNSRRGDVQDREPGRSGVGSGWVGFHPPSGGMQGLTDIVGRGHWRGRQ